MRSIRLAETDADIAGCFTVMRQLRAHLTEDEFVPRVRRQETGGYRLALLEEGGVVRAAAGFRCYDNLHSGRLMYVDDLVTDAGERSRGHGKMLIDWLIAHARASDCQTFELDSGVQRFDAHRFYLTNRMIISAHHFKLRL